MGNMTYKYQKQREITLDIIILHKFLFIKATILTQIFCLNNRNLLKWMLKELICLISPTFDILMQ